MVALLDKHTDRVKAALTFKQTCTAIHFTEITSQLQDSPVESVTSTTNLNVSLISRLTNNELIIKS